MPESPIKHLKLEQVMGTMPSALFLVDNDLNILYWNKAAERITGFTAEEAVGQPCSFLQGIPCGDSCALLDPDTQKPTQDGRCTVVTKSGKRITLLKNIDVLRNEQGEMIGGIESFIDITRQVELEKTLREQASSLETRVKERTADLARSESRFRSVLDSMDDFAYIANSEFRITFMNRAMQEHFDFTENTTCHKSLHNLDEVCSWCPMTRVLNNRTVRDERQFGPKSRTYEIIHSPLPSDDGSIQKLAVCRDITERKQTEVDLVEANRELDAFAHSISHDLRGILAPVVTYMDFLREQYRDVFDKQILQILSEVERQSERAIALLDDLLDLAQVGHVKPNGPPTDVNQLVKEITDEFAKEAEERSLELIAEQMHPTWVPETLVYQVFANLVGNALNYVESSGGPIEIGSWAEDDQTVYYVRDHGKGVSAKDRDNIFEIFYRGRSARGKKGTGVGLAIIRKIALRCQGTAWVEDTPGGGATFCISFPSKYQ